MSKGSNRLRFEIPIQDINETITWQLSHEVSLAKEVAQPLFDTGLHSIGIARKKRYPNKKQLKSDFHLLMLVLQGEMRIHLEEKKYVQKAGMISFCPKGSSFSRSSEGPIWWIYIHLFDKPIWNPLKEYGCYLRDYESTDYMLLLLSRILEARQNQTIKERLNALEYSKALADLIKREARFVEKHHHPHLDKLKRLIAKIEFSPEEPWSVSIMAKNVHVSPRSLNRIFHREYGMGPMDYVISKRLDRALEMLIYTDDKIEAVASSLGYKSLYSFSNLFLRHIGMRPGEFRNKYSSEK